MLEALLREHLPDVEVWAYGSRVSGRSHDGSDLDLALRAPGLRTIESARLAAFREALRQSNIPFLVEARDWARLPPRFHRVIEREHVVLAERSNRRGDDAWGEAALGDVVELKCGYNLPKQRRISGPIPVVSSSGVSGWHSERKVRGPGVVTGRYGTLGKVFYIPDDFWPLNTALYVHDFKGNDVRFVSYLLKELDFLAYSDKAAVPGVNRHHLHQASIRFPKDVREQRAIADVLGVLDERIEVHRRMNQTLEAMAQALFKDWFIDFGPTRAKTEGHKPHLPKPLWNLFPNQLTNSKLGQIPEGWETWRLDEIAEHRKEAVDPSREPEAVFEHYSIPAYDAGRHPAMDEGASIKSNKSRVPQHAVLLSKLNPDISRVWVPDDPGDAVQVASTEFLPYVPREGFGRGLLSALFRSLPFREVLQGMVTGTSRSHQRVPPKALNAVECLVGRPEHFSAFEAFADAALRRQMWNRREIRTLTALRDTLLPKLISGKIRLHNTGRQTESAA